MGEETSGGLRFDPEAVGEYLAAEQKRYAEREHVFEWFRGIVGEGNRWVFETEVRRRLKEDGQSLAQWDRHHRHICEHDGFGRYRISEEWLAD
jgi:hypothetical protein